MTESPPRRVTAWLAYQDDSDVELMRSLVDTLHTVSVGGWYPHRVTPAFIAATRALGLRVIGLVDSQAGPFATPTEADRTAEGLVALCAETGLDGIDLDYEHLPADARAAYAYLLQAAGERLRDAGKSLSVCVGYYPATHRDPSSGFIDPEAAGRHADEVRVMCYDQYFAPGKGLEPFDREDCQGVGPASSQPWARHVMEHWRRYVPVERLVMGLPAYGNDYSALPGGGGRALYTPYPPVGRFHVDKTWLWYEQLHLYRYTDEYDKPRLFYASDEDSTAAHLRATATAMGLAAVCFWQARAVTPAMWAVARAWRDGALPDATAK